MSGGERFDTLLLRFRDLATNRGDTIRTHAEICREHHKTLWGWWHKGFEKLPLRAFDRVRALASRPDGLGIYLFNAHERTFYAATVSNLHFERAGNEIRSPRPKLTPEYYRLRKCLAWFELMDIDTTKLDAKDLAQLAHVAVPSFFRIKNKVIEFAALHEQPLGTNAEQIESQSRTIWFLRSGGQATSATRGRGAGRRSGASGARAGRRTPRPTVKAFPSQRYKLTENTLLWLSDLHFSEATGATAPHAFDPQGGTGLRRRETLQDQILLVQDSAPGKNFGAVIVSGDISWSAEAQEFTSALGFLREIAGYSGRADPYKIALCPGNHDLQFSADPSDRYAEVEDTSKKSRSAFAAFHRNLFGVSPNKFLSMGRHYKLKNGVRVDVVCLNSSLLEQVPDTRLGGKHVVHFQGHGWVGPEQLKTAANQMGWKGQPSNEVVRVVVVHHHLLPVFDYLDPEIGDSYSTLLDADRLARWLVRHRVDVLLHGHMHEPFTAYVRRGIQAQDKDSKHHRFAVCGMGSTGVSQKHRRDGTPNFAAVLDIEPKKITLTMYQFTADVDTVSEALRWSIRIGGRTL